MPYEYGIPYTYDTMVKTVEEHTADAVIEALTTPVPWVQTETIIEQITTPGGNETPTSETITFIGEDYEEALEKFQQAFEDWGLSAGFVLVPPTIERVEAMLSGTSHSPDEVVTTTFDNTAATVKKIAISAVMAGAKPEHLPVILAVIKAGSRSGGEGNIESSPLVVVNGPIMNELGIASSMPGPETGTGVEANLAIARAIRLVGSNIGGRFTSTRMPVVTAEREADSPWAPYHVDKGYDVYTSTVTIMPISYSGATSLYVGSIAIQRPTCEEALYCLAHGMRGIEYYPAYSGGYPEDYLKPAPGAILMVGELLAKKIAADDISKSVLQYYLWRESGIYIGDLRKGASAMLDYFEQLQGPVYMDIMGDDILMPLVRDPDNFNIFVTGSGFNAYFWNQAIQRSVETEVVDDWR